MSRTKPTFCRAARSGFTLVEVLISVALSSVIMAAVLTAFLMIGRSGYNAGSYSIMEAESRRALETFSEEARMASDVTAYSDTSVTFTVLASTGTTSVTYFYDSANKQFKRTASGTTRILVRDVTAFAYRRYKVVNGVDYTATNPLETKQIQITLQCTRSRATVVDATNAVLSARVVLRNKQVST